MSLSANGWEVCPALMHAEAQKTLPPVGKIRFPSMDDSWRNELGNPADLLVALCAFWNSPKGFSFHSESLVGQWICETESPSQLSVLQSKMVRKSGRLYHEKMINAYSPSALLLGTLSPCRLWSRAMHIMEGYLRWGSAIAWGALVPAVSGNGFILIKRRYPSAP